MNTSSRINGDGILVVLVTGALATGTVMVLGGVAGQTMPMAYVGTLLLCIGAVTMLVADLVSGALLVALATPLPALLKSGDLRIATVAPVAAMVAFAWAIRRLIDRKPFHFQMLPLRTLALLIGAMGLAALLSGDVAAGARETLNFVVLAAFLLAATDEFAARPDRRQTTIDALIATAALCGALAVLEAIGVIPGNFPRWGTTFHRAALGFGQPNGLGLFLALILPLAVHRVGGARGVARVIAIIAVGLTGLGLLATFSRASWIAAMVALAILPLAGRGRAALRIASIAAVVLIAADVVSGGMIRDTFTRTLGDWVLEQRAALFIAGVQMFLAHPLTGVGPGGFADQVQIFAARITQLWDYQPTPHNAYVQMAAETGVIGLAAFMAFLWATFSSLRMRAAHRSGEDVAILAAFTILVVNSLGIWPFAHGTGEAVMLIVALGCSREAAS